MKTENNVPWLEELSPSEHHRITYWTCSWCRFGSSLMNRLWKDYEKKYFHLISNHPKPGVDLTSFFCSEFSKEDWKALKVWEPCLTQHSQRWHTCWLGQTEKYYSQFFPYLLSPPKQVHSDRLDSRWPSFQSGRKLCPVMSCHQVFLSFSKSWLASPQCFSIFLRERLFSALDVATCVVLHKLLY